MKFTKAFLQEITIVQCQNLVDSSPFQNKGIVIEKINQLEQIIGSIHDKAKVLLSLSYSYNDELPKSIHISK